MRGKLLAIYLVCIYQVIVTVYLCYKVFVLGSNSLSVFIAIGVTTMSWYLIYVLLSDYKKIKRIEQLLRVEEENVDERD